MVWLLDKNQSHQRCRERERIKDEELHRQRETHAIKIQQLERAHNDDKDQWNRKLIATENSWRDRLARSETEHAMTVENLKSDFNQRARRYEDEIDLTQQKLETTKVQLVRKYETAVSQLLQQQQLKEAQLNADHAKKMKSLIAELNESNSALLSRDDDSFIAPLFGVGDLKREPDEQIKAQFMSIVQLVDDLGRLVWRDDQKVWTEEVLQDPRANQNQRLLRKHIIQDKIWIILHRYVYCSPFRAFGKEGRILEAQWNERCGQDLQSNNGIYTWPEPGVEAERWRYFTIKECRKALMQPVPSEFDRKAELKREYKTNMDDLVSELKSTLDVIVELNGASIQTIERLARRLSNVWLEFGMHRCRIVILLQNSILESVSDEAFEIRSKSRELAIVPALGRYGNVKGMELNSFTIIGDCKGESVKLSDTEHIAGAVF